MCWQAYTVSPHMTLLREGLLDGRSVALAGSVPGPVRDGLAGLGARVETVPDELPEDEETVGSWAREHAPFHAIVFDAGAAFCGGGSDALTVALERAGSAVHEGAARAPSGGRARRARAVPYPPAGSHAAAAHPGPAGASPRISAAPGQQRVAPADPRPAQLGHAGIQGRDGRSVVRRTDGLALGRSARVLSR